MKINPVPDQSLIHDLFEYKSGKLFWQSRADVPKWWNTKYAGKRAGSLTTKGFWYVQVNKKGFFEHRLIWGYFFGDVPEGFQVGHRDDDKLNNNINNLDLYEETAMVLLKGHKPRKKAAQQIRGISKVGSKYRVEFMHKGKRHHCGYWNTEQDAQTAYSDKKKQIIAEIE